MVRFFSFFLRVGGVGIVFLIRVIFDGFEDYFGVGCRDGGTFLGVGR